ncbi:unnamed protein product [Pedinophyceae sp. YPF-701]|nr:unnamed protein product [Pedinophyceae sp. YPF-701]
MAVHKIDQISAKVPFSMMLLTDLVKSRKVPPEHRCRMVVPCSGPVSVSLWDTSDAAALLAWLDEGLSGYCESEVHPVVEEHCIGLALELTRARAAEQFENRTSKAVHAVDKIARGTADRIAANPHVQEMHQRVNTYAERGSHAVHAAGERARALGEKAMQNEHVATGVRTIRTSATWAQQKIGTFGSFLARQANSVVHSAKEYNDDGDGGAAEREEGPPGSAGPPDDAAPSAPPPPPAVAHGGDDLGDDWLTADDGGGAQELDAAAKPPPAQG